MGSSQTSVTQQYAIWQKPGKLVGMARNVLGDPLVPCSHEPLTGFYRDGCCNTGGQDQGLHLVCAVMTAEFLAFSKGAGNDLSTPREEWGFPGLKPGDRWCLCMGRWIEAYQAGFAPKLVLEATNELALEWADLATMKEYAI
jgi:hypothetical protein